MDGDNHGLYLKPEGALCKGSWLLGSACGRCERCRDEAAKLLPAMIEKGKLLDTVRQMIAAGAQGSQAYKLATLDEVRRLLP